MNKHIIFILLALIFFSCEQKNYKENICSLDNQRLDGLEVSVVEEPPIYKGGMNNYFKHIAKEIHRGRNESEWQSIIVVFVIDTLGRVRNECILNKRENEVFTSFEIEALKAVKNNQDWKPGEQNGKKVPVKMYLPLKNGHRGS